MVAAQSYKGRVMILEENGDPVPAAAAAVNWAPAVPGGTSTTLVYTDSDGTFSIVKGSSRALVPSYMGYKNDTLQVSSAVEEVEFLLYADAANLTAVTVTGRQQSNYISKLSDIKTEVITAAGLCKMACCNLAESFENSASVTVGYSDAVTGARQIRLLGS